MARSVTANGVRKLGAGDLTELVTIETETRTGDGYEGATQAWTTVATVWALVEPLFVGEREQLGAVRNATQYRITVYARDDVVETMRIRWRDTTHAIRGIRRGSTSELFMDMITETGLGD